MVRAPLPIRPWPRANKWPLLNCWGQNAALQCAIRARWLWRRQEISRPRQPRPSQRGWSFPLPRYRDHGRSGWVEPMTVPGCRSGQDCWGMVKEILEPHFDFIEVKKVLVRGASLPQRYSDAQSLNELQARCPALAARFLCVIFFFASHLFQATFIRYDVSRSEPLVSFGTAWRRRAGPLDKTNEKISRLY